MTIQQTIASLDEKRWTNGDWDAECTSGAIRHVVRNVDHDSYCTKEDDHDSFGKYDGEYIAMLHNSYPTLRNAALEAERYKLAGEELAKVISEMTSFSTCYGEHEDEYETSCDCKKYCDAALSLYRQAVEQKEV